MLTDSWLNSKTWFAEQGKLLPTKLSFGIWTICFYGYSAVKNELCRRGDEKVFLSWMSWHCGGRMRRSDLTAFDA